MNNELNSRQQLYISTQDNASDLPAYYVSHTELNKCMTSVKTAIELVPPDANLVLDIGCSAGQTGYLLKRKQNAQVVGIEFNPKAAEKASKLLDQVLILDLDKVQDLPLPEHSFDCALCLDIVEHLLNPSRLLLLLSRYLKKEGTLITSIPNIQHKSTISQLLLSGQFGGAVATSDPGHLNYFTFFEIVELLNKTGFQIDKTVMGAATDENPAFKKFYNDIAPFLGIQADLSYHLSMIVQFIMKSKNTGNHVENQQNETFSFHIIPNTVHVVN